jgi:hypothetical protein
VPPKHALASVPPPNSTAEIATPGKVQCEPISANPVQDHSLGPEDDQSTDVLSNCSSFCLLLPHNTASSLSALDSSAIPG